ncbi:alpha/beta hydrolase [Lichenibacterium minor]|uniref:Alpha/beta hydrolase n=1 Tax=Lichenibacterium minor TaxID=2316528 RepID=A0A4Q2U5J3_9HYPH|nr:patatin-like phospholipase family protein [Lichenibacterium minor]RYC31078.1 alpha/beta hydrolase [Lichenibacterium minor]
MPIQRKLLAALALSSFLGACALTPREPFTAAEQAAAAVPGFGPVRAWGDAPARDLARAVLGPIPSHDVNVLALSGGGAGGAFAAGLLDGWTRRGTRPSFDVVTGVSTGALIAPFAFLGSAYDATLARLYTGDGAGGVAEPANLIAIATGDGLLDSGPLRRMVDSYVTPEFLARVAAEHRRGRRLLVVSTNLDAQRPVVWDMGAIAASPNPEAAALFRDVLVASASVPAVFPPVMIAAAAGGRAIREMHVDGVATAQIFIRPDMIAAAAPRRRVHVWAVVNNTLPPEFAVTAKGTLPIAYRSLSTVFKAQAAAEVTAASETARRLGQDFELAYIDRAVPFDPAAPFGASYMDKAFAIGTGEAADGSVWHRDLAGLGEPAKPS